MVKISEDYYSSKKRHEISDSYYFDTWWADLF